MKPIGLYTELVESLTSFISRLAESHMISVGALLGKVIAPTLSKNYINCGSGFYPYAIELNSLGDQASEFVQALSLLTGIDNIKNLTLTSFHGTLSSRDMLSPNKKWCPMCFEDWKNTSKTIYEPLIWYFKSANVCTEHKINLEKGCPNCAKSLPILSRTSRNGFCQYCGSWLGSSGSEVNEEINLDEHAWDYYVVNNIGSLLKVSNELNNECSFNNIHAFLNNTLLKICYSLDMDITKLFDQNQLGDGIMKSFNVQSNFQTSKGRKFVRKFNWQVEEVKILNIINNKNNIFPSVHEVARLLDCSERLLYEHFPELCKSISEKHSLFIKSLKEKHLDFKRSMGDPF